MKTIKNYKDLKKHINKVKQKILKAPFCGPNPENPHMGIDEFGHFFIDHEGYDYFAPEEALRLGKWLVEFYGDE